MSDAKLKNQIGKRLKQARQDAGFRFATEAADRIRMHRQNVSDHEAGRKMVQPPDLIRYSKGYKVSIDWLLTGKNPSKSAIRSGLEIIEKLDTREYKEVIEFAKYKLASAK